MWREGVEQDADALPCGFEGSLGGFAQEQFELGEDLFDGVQVGRVGRQEDEPGPDAADRLADGGTFVTTKIVHDDDIARCKGRHEELGDVGAEALAVDRSIENARRVDPVVTESGQKGQRAPFAERGMRDEFLPTRCPAPDRRHVRLCPSLVDEDQSLRVKPALILLPLGPAPRDGVAVLLLGEQAFF